jgi:hypothetical protein
MQALVPTGESDDYIMATIALEQHGSLLITESDIEQVRQDFPEQYKYVKTSFANKEATGFFFDKAGNAYPWYMGTYSISVLPVKCLLKLFGLSPSYTYVITNVLLYTIALCVVYCSLKASRKNIFLTILLLVCSPIVAYFTWASAEVFICSLIILSLLFFVNGNRYLAALFASIASTLNITIAGWLIVILVDYFVHLFLENRRVKLKELIVNNWKPTILLAICFLPSLFTPVYNLTHFGVFNLQNVLVQNQSVLLRFYWARFLSYFFDLNLGFLPYFPILLIAFFIIFVMSIIKRNHMGIALGLGLLGTVALYSAMPHINCGMQTIARYNAWTTPFLVFMVATQFQHVWNGVASLKVINAVKVVSAIVTMAITVSTLTYIEGCYVYFTPSAQFVMSYAPELYNPYPYTFISRSLHIDGGYINELEIPVAYIDNDHKARKILLDRGSYRRIEELFSADDRTMLKIKKKVEQFENSNKIFSYINLSSLDNVRWAMTIDSFPALGIPYGYYIEGAYSIENWNGVNVAWFSPKVQAVFDARQIERSGLEFDFDNNLQILPLSDVPHRTTITINNKVVKIIELTQGHHNEVVNAEELPKPDADGQYKIKIETDGKHTPSELKEGADTRDLTVAVYYLGPVRNK